MRCVACLIALLTAGCASAGARHPRPGVDTFVRMERTECLGRCPIYTVTLFEDGRVLYQGGKLAPAVTEWRRISAAEAARVLDAAQRLEPWTCAPDRIATDYPEAIITVSRGGRVRRIVYDHGDPCAPRAVRRVEGEIDVAGGHPQVVP
jgi:hypothetical protein